MVINFSENQNFSVIPHLPALDCDRGMRNPDFLLKWEFNLLSGFLVPRYLIRGYLWIPAGVYPVLIRGGNDKGGRNHNDY